MLAGVALGVFSYAGFRRSAVYALGPESGLSPEELEEGDPFSMAMILGVMALLFVMVPLMVFVSRRKKKDDWAKPHAFVFDNDEKRLEVYENEESVRAEAWLPYAQIATFDVDTYSVTTGNGSDRRTRTYYVARMVKRDGSTWDLNDCFHRDEAESFVATIKTHVGDLLSSSVSQPGSTASTSFLGLEGSPIRRETGERGPMFIWQVQSLFTGIILGFIVTGLLAAAGWATRTPSHGIDLFLLMFWSVDAVFFVLLIQALFKGLRRINTEQALCFARDGLATGLVRPRGSGRFKAEKTIPYSAVGRVSFDWKQRSGSNTSGEMIILDRNQSKQLFDATAFMQQRRVPDLSEIAKMLKIHSDGIRIPLGNLRLSDAIRLESAIEDEINNRGGQAE